MHVHWSTKCNDVLLRKQYGMYDQAPDGNCYVVCNADASSKCGEFLRNSIWQIQCKNELKHSRKALLFNKFDSGNFRFQSRQKKHRQYGRADNDRRLPKTDVDGRRQPYTIRRKTPQTAAYHGRLPLQATADGRIPPQTAADCCRLPLQATADGRIPPQTAADRSRLSQIAADC